MPEQKATKTAWVKKSFLWWEWWKPLFTDKGKRKPYNVERNGTLYEIKPLCWQCGTRIRIGRFEEDNYTFRYCPKCRMAL